MKNIIALLMIAMLAACAPAVTDTPEPFTPLPPTVTATASSTPMPAALWISPAVPPALRGAALAWPIPQTDDPQIATQRLEVSDQAGASTWIYALVAPFPTMADGVSINDLLGTWHGAPAGSFDFAPPAGISLDKPFEGRPIWMAESTLAAFSARWGEPAKGSVRTVDADQLLAAAWGDQPSWAIIPFEEIQPKWKVLLVDGQSPIRKNFNVSAYPLKIGFALTSLNVERLTFNLPTTNRDPEKLTTLILTGTTALVDATAYVMETKGVTHPGMEIRDWLREADITHISNEVPFDEDCPFPNPGNRNLAILCSRPQYMELLTDIGTDVVELTGDHFNNRGTAAMVTTLQMYRDAGLPYYGGGENLADSKKPLLMEYNGNKFMFIGCNMKMDYSKVWATAFMPGAAPCDFPYMTEQIRHYRAEGYLPIVTFQDYEYYSPEIRPGQLSGFRQMADAGAIIVSGSQGHYPQVMEFYNDSFIHYALGNLFYTQMSYSITDPDGSVIVTEKTRWEFLDRHVFYDGRYISTELLTAMLEEYASPRPMTSGERTVFLNEYFHYSGWMGITPTPVPAPTMTLTPLWIPTFAGTPAWPPSPTATATPQP